MITLKASRFVAEYDEDTGKHKVFLPGKEHYEEVTTTLSDDEKEELINDLIYCVYDLLKNHEN